MLEDTRQTSLCKPVSKTILLGCENGSFPSLFDCHLAISQSSTACYTSFKRGDSGLPADVKIRTIFQLIGIVWSYFLRISRYQCIYICICIQIRIQIVSKYLVSFPSLYARHKRDWRRGPQPTYTATGRIFLILQNHTGC